MFSRRRSDIVVFEMSNFSLHLANPDISIIFDLKSVQKFSLDTLIFECIQLDIFKSVRRYKIEQI